MTDNKKRLSQKTILTAENAKYAQRTQSQNTAFQLIASFAKNLCELCGYWISTFKTPSFAF
jgi:hypothetical protein